MQFCSHKKAHLIDKKEAEKDRGNQGYGQRP